MPLRFGTAPAWAVRFHAVHFVTTNLHAKNLQLHEDQCFDDDQRPDSGPASHRHFHRFRPQPAVQKRAPRDSSEHERSCSNPRNAAEGARGQLDRLNLTHAQREQVEQFMAGEALQLQMAHGNPNLAVARVFAQEQAIRLQTRKQIASMLSPKQRQKVTELMTRRAVKLENRANDY